MKYEEYEAIAKTLTTENAPEIVKTMLEGIKLDTENLESMTKAIEEKDSKIQSLMDTNIKLFLSASTGKADDDPKTEEELAEERIQAADKEIEALLKGE